jgi:drug/metabolite transporter (DMT)-like permease
MVCFTACNLLIGEMAHLRLEVGYYNNTGAFLVSLIYFWRIKCIEKDQTLFVDHQHGRFDWSLVMCYMVGAMFGTLVFLTINWSFYLCSQAGLNIGIA